MLVPAKKNIGSSKITLKGDLNWFYCSKQKKIVAKGKASSSKNIHWFQQISHVDDEHASGSSKSVADGSKN